MADIIIDGTTVINKTGDAITQTFPGPNHTFTVKAVNQAISGATNSTKDNANSDQLAIYNGSTKLWGITEEGFALNPTRPYFHAHGHSNLTHNNISIYPTTIANVGGHYNTSNGNFTAPIDGYYLFGWTSIGGNGEDVKRWYIRINGSKIGANSDIHLRQDTRGKTNYATNAFYVLPWQLYAGDYIHIFYVSDDSETPYASNDASNDYPRFWGYLLG